MITFFKKRTQGFTLLIAVIVMTFALSVGLSLTSVVVKEFSITNNLRESMKAFYAVESGFECARYWIVHETEFFVNPIGQGTLDIECDGESHDVGNGSLIDGRYIYNIELGTNSTPFSVQFDHDANIPESLQLSIIGLNINDDDSQNLTQRFRKADVVISLGGVSDADIILVVDTSGSICRGPEEPPPLPAPAPVDDDCPDILYGEPSEWDLLMTAMQDFLDTFREEDNSSSQYKNGIRVGLVGFHHSAYYSWPLTKNANTISGQITNEALSAEGRTNIVGGLEEAHELFVDFEDEREDIIVVITDGLPTLYINREDDASSTFIGDNLDSHNFKYWDADPDFDQNGGGGPPSYPDQSPKDDTKDMSDIFQTLGIQINVIGVGGTQSNDTFMKEDIVTYESKNEGIFVPVVNYSDLSEALLDLANDISITLLQIK